MNVSRRLFLAAVPAGLTAVPAGERIDRAAVVRRHRPTLTALDPRSPLSVGNGEFVFSADVTGLQTFPEAYEQTISLCTQSQWGWHTAPNPTGQGPGDYRPALFDTHGRPVPYPTTAEGQKPLYDWLRDNPHRLHLGRIGFVIPHPGAISGIRQTLDPWTGILRSEFRYAGRGVVVETCCHPRLDLVAVSVRGGPPVRFDFPYGSPAMNAADWSHPEKHATVVAASGSNRVDLSRTLDRDRYGVTIAWQGAGGLAREGPHRFTLRPTGEEFQFVCAFSPGDKGTPSRLPSVSECLQASREYWDAFWNSGAAMDCDGSRDARAREFERRVVLSQYQTAIQCAGSLPPQETGLTCNSWNGKFHLEMHYWHAAHFAEWGRPALLERSMGWYATILPSAREKARSQGFSGARWPKMTGPEGRDSPSPIGPLLIWQQPHPIALAELCYRAHPNRETLERYRNVVLESAEFMASYAWLDPKTSRYVLGPPVIPAQENHPPRETWNPAFELEYWNDALGTAQRWRERLSMRREPKWDDVRMRLSQLPVKDGVYLAHENCPETFTARNHDHPSMLGALGVLPGAMVDRETMRRTLRKVMTEWSWEHTWGWDFPMVAMTAASLGENAIAIEALMMETPKNTWLPNGHNWQRPGLPLYLPGNGGLLLAAAHMVRHHAFPADTWTVRAEGF